MTDVKHRAATAADPVVVARLCEQAGRPALMNRLLTERLTVEQVEQRLEDATAIIAAGESAAQRHPRMKHEAVDVCRILADDGCRPSTARAILGCMEAAQRMYEQQEDEAFERGEIETQ